MYPLTNCHLNDISVGYTSIHSIVHLGLCQDLPADWKKTKQDNCTLFIFIKN